MLTTAERAENDARGEVHKSKAELYDHQKGSEEARIVSQIERACREQASET
jgi:hypothetical protein